ncbi:methyl-viologen-reducing hydrogenase subunit delta [candidate division TA06 bacterium DG_78]|uniref:Methyl-viologen-reducing hydrogenase subunit delta n=1 Tax=candidate division TA06 bacterium DG_78 TaxID=1703772 RepID=A0A0S7YGI8_UNCT6|nr:MAG: methyl-viologen-reducing hydrogenase subunit delta [candidate division TA06 bacterium DG_78]
MTEDSLPRIVGFLCKWCSYAGADLAGVSRLKMPASLVPIRVMCSSRVNPLFVLKAFLSGADGILVTGCHPGDCHYQDGNYYTRRRFALTQKIFKELGLEADRIRLSWISASEGKRFVDVVTEFTENLKTMGKNSIKAEIFL